MSFNSSMQQLFTGIASTVAGLIIVTEKNSNKLIHYDWVGYLSLAMILFCVFLGHKVGEGEPKTSLPITGKQDIADVPAHSI